MVSFMYCLQFNQDVVPSSSPRILETPTVQTYGLTKLAQSTKYAKALKYVHYAKDFKIPCQYKQGKCILTAKQTVLSLMEYRHMVVFMWYINKNYNN